MKTQSRRSKQSIISYLNLYLYLNWLGMTYSASIVCLSSISDFIKFPVHPMQYHTLKGSYRRAWVLGKHSLRAQTPFLGGEKRQTEIRLRSQARWSMKIRNLSSWNVSQKERAGFLFMRDKQSTKRCKCSLCNYAKNRHADVLLWEIERKHLCFEKRNGLLISIEGCIFCLNVTGQRTRSSSLNVSQWAAKAC